MTSFSLRKIYVFYVHPVSSPLSSHSEFYLPFLFPPPLFAVLLYISSKEGDRGDFRLLVNPRALSSRSKQGTHPLKLLK